MSRDFPSYWIYFTGIVGNTRLLSSGALHAFLLLRTPQCPLRGWLIGWSHRGMTNQRLLPPYRRGWEVLRGFSHQIPPIIATGQQWGWCSLSSSTWILSLLGLWLLNRILEKWKETFGSCSFILAMVAGLGHFKLSEYAGFFPMLWFFRWFTLFSHWRLQQKNPRRYIISST